MKTITHKPKKAMMKDPLMTSSGSIQMPQATNSTETTSIRLVLSLLVVEVRGRSVLLV
jgi:hypothetical protein